MLVNLLKYYRLLSLDVVAGAVLSSLAISEWLQLAVSFPTWVALGIAVWIIYTVDHLIDAKAIHHTAHTERHRFHQKNFKSLLITTLIFALIGIVTIFFLPVQIIRAGIIVSGIAIMYFSSVWLSEFTGKWFKELAVAIVYVTGIFTAPLSLYPNEMEPDVVIIVTQFFLLALLNLFEFSYFEKHTDLLDGQKSLVTSVGSRISKFLIKILMMLSVFSVFVVLIFFPVNYNFLKLQVIILLMALVLSMVYFFRSYFRQKERYRFYGDGVFLLPALYLI